MVRQADTNTINNLTIPRYLVHTSAVCNGIQCVWVQLFVDELLGRLTELRMITDKAQGCEQLA